MKLEKYRKTMNEDVLHSWAVDAQKMLDDLQAESYAELKAENDALNLSLNEAVARIKDILMQDDCQSYKEALKFLDKLGVSVE